MNDLLNDQKIHYIVKDYKRMYEGFHALVEENKSLRAKNASLAEKIGFLRHDLLKAKAEREKKLDGATKGLLNNCHCQIDSLKTKANRVIEQIEALAKTYGDIDSEIRKNYD